MYRIVLFSVAAILGAMAALLLSGRGAFLISGYNTASPQQKAAYDEKKLCRVNGAGLAVIAALFSVMAILGESMPPWFIAVFLGVTLATAVLTVVLARTVCRVEGAQIHEPTEEELRKSRIAKRASIGIGIAAVTCAAVMMFTGDIVTEFTDDTLIIRADHWNDYSVRYEDISAIELRQDAPAGLRVGGLGSARLLAGNFRSEELGNHTRYTYTACSEAVVMTVRGRTVVLSGEDAAATQRLYEELCLRTGLS